MLSETLRKNFESNQLTVIGWGIEMSVEDRYPDTFHPME